MKKLQMVFFATTAALTDTKSLTLAVLFSHLSTQERWPTDPSSPPLHGLLPSCGVLGFGSQPCGLEWNACLLGDWSMRSRAFSSDSGQLGHACPCLKVRPVGATLGGPCALRDPRL